MPLTESEYVECGEEACSQIRDLVESDLKTTWPFLEWDEPDLKIYGRKPTEFPEAHENMLMLVTTFDTSITNLERLLFPWFEYRVQWDELLQQVDILKKLDPEAYVVRHVVKRKLTLSARDSVDAVKLDVSPFKRRLQVSRDENGVVIMGSKSTRSEACPPQAGFVRTRQSLGGYYMRPAGADRTQFFMLFCADLNLPVPRFISNVVARLKPRLMVDKARNLAKAVGKSV